MTQAKALLLDAMGTLIGLRQSVGTLYSAAAADYGLELEAESLDRAFAQAYSQAPPLAFPGVTPAHLEQAERSWWQQRIDTTFKAAGVKNLPIGLAGELFDRFAQPEPWAVYAEVPDALERWRQSGLALMVVSNFDRRLHGLLEQLGLRDAVDGVLVSSEAGAAKPDPALFEAALSQVPCSAEQALLIGDSGADQQAAAAAGMRCLRLQRPSGLLVP